MYPLCPNVRHLYMITALIAWPGENAPANTYQGGNRPGGVGGAVCGSALFEAGCLLGSGGGSGFPHNRFNEASDNADSGKGGAGGGVIDIFAREFIEIKATAALRANGSDGTVGAVKCHSGGGGGSGGSILLRSPRVALDGMNAWGDGMLARVERAASTPPWRRASRHRP